MLGRRLLPLAAALAAVLFAIYTVQSQQARKNTEAWRLYLDLSANGFRRDRRSGEPDVVSDFTTGGVDIHLRGPETGITVLMCAGLWQDRKLAAYALRRRVDVNTRMRNGGATALTFAAIGGDPEIVRMLLQHGADVDARHDPGANPLRHAASDGHVEVVRLLLQHGADPDVDYRGYTPLRSARESAEGMRKLMRDYSPTDPQRGVWADEWTRLRRIIRMLREAGARK